MKTNTYWYRIRDDCVWNGEEFFVKANSKDEADAIVKLYWLNVHVTYLGRVSEYFAECMGLDTY